MSERIGLLDYARFLWRLRFMKFGLVGFFGVAVNWGFLYLGHEYLFVHIAAENVRLNLSLTVAIFFATINNFFWNMIWTWQDRHGKTVFVNVFVQLGQYFAVCSVAICLQFLITNVLAGRIHYLLANIIAIVFAATINYFLNDLWTFRLKREKG